MANRIRPAIPIRGTRVGVNDTTHDFVSIAAAAKWLLSHGHPCTNHRQNIKTHIDNQRQYCGYMWEVIAIEDVQVEHEENVDVEESPPDSLSIILGYAGNTQVSLRTTPETPRRVSVFDLITVMTGTNNPHDTYHRVCTQYQEVRGLVDDFLFQGQGQRPTPVVDARGAVYLMHVLQGHKASLFRINCADIVVRYLGGDETLVAGIQRNAEIQAALPRAPHAHIWRSRGSSALRSSGGSKKCVGL